MSDKSYLRQHLEGCRRVFRKTPDIITAGSYLLSAGSAVPIKSQEYDDIKVEVGFWLQTGRLFILADEPR